MVIMPAHLQHSSSRQWIRCKQNLWDSSSCRRYRWRWVQARARDQGWKAWHRRCRGRAMSTRCGCGWIITTTQRDMDRSSNLTKTKKLMERLRRSRCWTGISTLCRLWMKDILLHVELKQLKPLWLTQTLSLDLSWPQQQIMPIVRTA